ATPVPSTTIPGGTSTASPAIPNIPAIDDMALPSVREVRVEPKKAGPARAQEPAKSTPPPVRAEPLKPTLPEVRVEAKPKAAPAKAQVTPAKAEAAGAKAQEPAKTTPPLIRAEPPQPAGTQKDLPADVFSAKPKS